jgi:hypothetical protein
MGLGSQEVNIPFYQLPENLFALLSKPETLVYDSLDKIN